MRSAAPSCPGGSASSPSRSRACARRPFGVWVGVGSRDETPALAGTSHFLEHLLFKGTKRRDALEIAAELDAVGGEINAFTDKEYTCYYARVLDTDLPLAVDVVCDMVTSSLIRSRDVEAERGVILEEIAMHDDDPGDVVHDLFAEALYGDTPLGRPVIGTVESIEALTRASIAGFYRRRYVPPGDGRRDRRQPRPRRGGRAGRAGLRRPARRRRPSPRRAAAPTAGRRRAPASCSEDRPTEQANLVLGTLGRRPQRPAALGAAGAQRRPRRRAEQPAVPGGARGARAGLLGLLATPRPAPTPACSASTPAARPASVDEVLDVVRAELDDVAAHGLTDAEVARAKGALRGSLVLGLEDTGSRMSRIGKAELVDGEVLEVDELLARIAAVTPDDVRAVAADVLRRPLALGVVGPFGDRDFEEAVA